MPPLQLLYLKYKMLFSDVTVWSSCRGAVLSCSVETRAVWLAGGMSFHLSSARNNQMEKRGNTGEEDIICQYCFVVQSETLHPAGSVCSLQNDTSTINIAGYSPFLSRAASVL